MKGLPGRRRKAAEPEPQSEAAGIPSASSEQTLRELAAFIRETAAKAEPISEVVAWLHDRNL